MGKRSLIIVILPFCLCACASGLKSTSFFNSDLSSYDVICEDQASAHKIKPYLDVTIQSRSLGSITLLGPTGNKITVQSSNCILERIDKFKELPVPPNQSMVSAMCSIGDVQFSASDLQKVDEDKTLNYLKRHDGKIWLLPKAKCPPVEQSQNLGE
jgi:hypothetical protein